MAMGVREWVAGVGRRLGGLEQEETADESASDESAAGTPGQAREGQGFPPGSHPLREQVNLTAYSVNPTQEDYYWGRIASGAEEDYYWRRLSDNWYQKDVIPSTYLEIHNQCYEAFNANP